MDILDNVIFANLHSNLLSGAGISSDYILPTYNTAMKPINLTTAPNLPVYSYPTVDKMNYLAFQDHVVIDKAIQKHWHDLNARVHYDGIAGVDQVNTVPAAPDPTPPDIRYSSFTSMMNYNMIYAYLLENTRMLQIFERLIERYMFTEDFGIADNPLAFNWIHNTEQLFFKNDSPATVLRSMIRPNADATRRNAYWRMYGMDLSFGDINGTNTSVPYIKSKTSNQQFVILFERYLGEVWQGYINARNSSGANTTDINIIMDLAMQIRELLKARRGNVGATSYWNLQLSREEFSSVLINSWFLFAISDNTPIVEFMKCTSSTVGERLLKIGAKVGVPAHSKSQSLFEMAGPASNVLSLIEAGGVLDDGPKVQNILSSLNPPATPSLFANYMSDLLTVINNWERATGHRIKNPEAKINGVVKVSQNGAKPKMPMGNPKMPSINPAVSMN
jgi:hypothetical protein